MQTKKLATQTGKVLVALSGGVDSSVAAALLLEAGYEVEGAFIVTWSVPWLPCTWREERRDAMRVAAQLHIPFHTVDLSKEYEENVAHYFIEEYKKGRTPNPDVMCNKYIKFGGFFDWARERGFDYVATGHYARVAAIEADGKQVKQLLAGVDTNKDQSYFLWNLTQEHLVHTLFPVGELTKPEVRAKATQFNLPTAQKKDSQGICFLGKVDMKEFLSHYIDIKPGAVLDEEGRVIGEHDGAVFLTLGQRHGFTVFQKTPDSQPHYVVAKDSEHNTVTVSENRNVQDVSQTQAIHLEHVNWISGQFTGFCEARLRYRQPLFPVEVTQVTETQCVVTPKIPERFVPSGQSMVLYNGNICLGGGVIG